MFFIVQKMWYCLVWTHTVCSFFIAEFSLCFVIYNSIKNVELPESFIFRHCFTFPCSLIDTVNSFLESCVGGVFYWNDLFVWFGWAEGEEHFSVTPNLVTPQPFTWQWKPTQFPKCVLLRQSRNKIIVQFSLCPIRYIFHSRHIYSTLPTFTAYQNIKTIKHSAPLWYRMCMQCIIICSANLPVFVTTIMGLACVWWKYQNTWLGNGG
jgi:hypothetical protein